MPKFLHTADWQMGRTYSRFDTEDGAALVEARYEAIERLAALATEHQCDAVLVAGDVFDAQTVSDRTIRRVFNATRGFDGPWVMLPGNHDAALAESVWTRAKRLDAVPKNVYLALESGVTPLPEQGIAVLSAPLTQRHTYGDLTQPFDDMETPPELLRIGLAHGSVQGLLPEDIDSTNPIAPDRTETAKLDYLGLGDWHGVREINARTWYSGTPEPERFRNNDAGYVLIVDIKEPGATPKVTRHETARYQWHQWRESLSVPSDLDELLHRISQLPEASVLDLKLAGTLTLAGDQKLTEALSIAEARYRAVTCDRTRLQLEPTDDDISALLADGYLGEVVQELRESQQAVDKGSDAEVARDALAILASLLKPKDAEVAQ
ncbi:DNA repair exonuclease SbcCD nuclease subunit [Marinobacter antarcticus]|uniref:DNA repair exonuclease SbcCD nuclease subunit n=1 Tax=Marinobacter antarcticus TaxID=564117 RepID=A0A1M6U727_9GAMM|nr:DNA repair exonuclease [Marinobacter antarcticus]SHK64970.1 DNA repair exonuclease SbcCD nuclease subunit [Marinobacter antarcticus]